jgi:hypothetical protein
MLIINSDDFLSGILSDYLTFCEARLYNSSGVAFTAATKYTDIGAYQLNQLNGYAPQTVTFQAPSIVTIEGERYVRAEGTEEIRWLASGGSLGGGQVTHVGLVSRLNTTPRLVHLIAVNPQETAPGSGVFSAGYLTVSDGNSLAFTPSVMFRDDILLSA